jgi:hypothetical protein
MTTKFNQTDADNPLQQTEFVEPENNPRTVETSFKYKMVVSLPDDEAVESDHESVDFRYVQHGRGRCACCGPLGK